MSFWSKELENIMWNINKQQTTEKNTNAGMTLVELLVAFAVSAVILTGLSYMLVTSLRLYSRTNANVDAQNESQTALNLVLDSILQANGVCLIEEDPSSLATDAMTCALFGKLDLHDDKSMVFTGDAILWQPTSKEMYLMSGTYSLGNYTTEAEAPLEAITAMKSELPSDRDDRLPYLMAQNIASFQIKTEESSFAIPETTPAAGEDVSAFVPKYYFRNPLILDVSMKVEVAYQNDKTVVREMSDSVAVRNRLNAVYIQREGKGMIKYLRNPA